MHYFFFKKKKKKMKKKKNFGFQQIYIFVVEEENK